MATLEQWPPTRSAVRVVGEPADRATRADVGPVLGWGPYRGRGDRLAELHLAPCSGLAVMPAPPAVVDAGLGWRPRVPTARPEDHDLNGPPPAWRILRASFVGDPDYDLALAAAGILRRRPAPRYGVTGLLSGYLARGGPGALQPRLVEVLLATGTPPDWSGERALLSGRAGTVRACRGSRSA